MNRNPPSGARSRKVQPAKELPDGYENLLMEIKATIQTARTKAILSVNRELIGLYWNIGKSIVERQRKEGWGKAVVNKLASDIQAAFPGISGFSPLNIWRMRAFYLAWTKDLEELSQPVTELGQANLSQLVTEIPWSHNIILVQRLKDPHERIWYARKTAEFGWSRNMLSHQIDSLLHRREGRAVTNFGSTLSVSDANMAAQMMKDPYNFDFLGLGDSMKERELERALMEQMRHFLLELGSGFAFVGQQMHLEVDGNDFYIDLLFYHLRLRCYIVIDLKVEDFKPEFVGKMNFYLSAVDDALRHPEDRPSVGLIICRTRSRTIAEYSLRDMGKPMGIARYVTKLPKDYREMLPSREELEKGLG